MPEIIQSSSEPSVFLSSEDFNDPSLHVVLQWHLQLCKRCHPNSFAPIRFGQQANPGSLCEEYFEIISEYSEYEGQYAWKGNP